MQNFSWNQMNETWRNVRLTLTAVIFPVFGFVILLYTVCDPFKKWVNQKLEKIFNKKKEEK